MEWGPNTKTFEAKDNGQRKLGWGPNTKAFEAKDNGQRKLGWAQHKEMQLIFQQAKQVRDGTFYRSLSLLARV
ncbi:hypothetical protein HMPREF2679_09590 [Staphylococcus sp. HMSC060A04]|nr:hypothetical protein AL499_05055 [Staphylococcus lugdunensis]OHP17350.1 hypothetical protein HMPREF2679_09590 [Staphylococcus sp. HMSC060A04]OHP78442.1 hypothetical protein HMPREF2543_05295 [Staphylococcus sp. HMSC062E08]